MMSDPSHEAAINDRTEIEAIIAQHENMSEDEEVHEVDAMFTHPDGWGDIMVPNVLRARLTRLIDTYAAIRESPAFADGTLTERDYDRIIAQAVAEVFTPARPKA